ncbi:hypothetical protein EVAR_12508_1 [Eumeta japonica]|uniref:Uncharacterized protein n=1 Tax=Eumeta variegata TaxID=151549 RepID=A0A4C1TPM0_EUMVA|nr:hypothetical protein EVAR_12508_1 [Eumeta japonica]
MNTQMKRDGAEGKTKKKNISAVKKPKPTLWEPENRPKNGPYRLRGGALISSPPNRTFHLFYCGAECKVFGLLSHFFFFASSPTFSRVASSVEDTIIDRRTLSRGHLFRLGISVDLGRAHAVPVLRRCCWFVLAGCGFRLRLISYGERRTK